MSQESSFIKANARSIRELLDKTKYQIDVFQREYKWKTEQISQLIEDLESKFLSEFTENSERKDVQNYARYYMGSVIISTKDGKRSIIDGQQRLTSITLLLIYLNNLQRNNTERVSIDELIFSEKFGSRSYNLEIPDRVECMESLYKQNQYNSTDKGESVQNIINRYQDIEELFPEELKNEKLVFFIDWLIENVVFVEILTNSDDDAYTIFETMNDRGLNLSSTEMLKGYILSNIETDEKKIEANKLWKDQILKIEQVNNDDSYFFQSWLRGKYATSQRERKKGSEKKDFEKIANRFHNWVRDNKETLGLQDKTSFYNFIKRDFMFYSNLFIKISNASKTYNKELRHIFYIEQLGFASSFYYTMLIASITINDDEQTINSKLDCIARFMEIFYIFRKINRRTTSYSAISYTMFEITKDIRNKSLSEIIEILKEKTNNLDEDLSGIQTYGLETQNKKYVRYILARITNHIETKSGMTSSFENYLTQKIEKPYEIEHIWANKIEYQSTEFSEQTQFEEWRNKIGALVLIPKGVNQSYSDSEYEEKLPHYYSQNLLARSLNSQCYEKDPSFTKYVTQSKLPFKPHNHFKKKDISERLDLYQKICEEIWNVKGYEQIT